MSYPIGKFLHTLGIAVLLFFSTGAGASAPPRSSPYAESICSQDPNVFFCEDFEGHDIVTYGNQNGAACNTSWGNPALQQKDICWAGGGSHQMATQTLPGFSSNNTVWRVTKSQSFSDIETGINTGTGSGTLAGWLRPEILGTGAREWYARIQVWFSPDHLWPDEYDFKMFFALPGQFIDPPSAPYETGMSFHQDFWCGPGYISPSGGNFNDVPIVRYSNNFQIFPYQNEYCPPLSPGVSPDGIHAPQIPKSRWTTLEYHIKLASNNTGIIELWVDGVRAYASQRITCSSNCPDMGYIMIMGWMNGADRQAGHYEIDNVVMSRSYIGVPGGTSSTPPPPPVDTTAPTVNITSPSNGATVSSTISVVANAADNVGVTGVQFKIDGQNLGSEDMTAPYSVSLDPTLYAAGSHALAAIARDNAGNMTTSSTISVSFATSTPLPPPSADTTAPTVSITSPANGATVSGIVTYTASISDNVGVVKGWMSIDGVMIDEDFGPYSNQWDTSAYADGGHALKVEGFDAAGNIGSKTIMVTVANAAPAPTPPPSPSPLSISGLSLVNNDTAGGFITALADGGTIDLAKLPSKNLNVEAKVSVSTGVGKVDFLMDGFNHSELASPYALCGDWTSCPSTLFNLGSHNLSVTPYDSAGIQGTKTSISFQVIDSSLPAPLPPPVADITPPTVQITAPLPNANVRSGSLVVIKANASDNVGVQRVEFYVNGALKKSDLAAPYDYSWRVPKGSGITYQLEARAYDAAGNKSSSTVSVKSVRN